MRSTKTVHYGTLTSRAACGSGMVKIGNWAAVTCPRCLAQKPATTETTMRQIKTLLVQTKYIKPTATRGARVKAMCASFKPLTLGFNHGMSPGANHLDAARTLLVQRGWEVLSWERYDSPTLGNGWCYLFAVRDTL